MTQWAVACGCGEILEYPNETAARRGLTWWETHRHRNVRGGMTGPATLLRRKVIFSDWESANDLATA